MRILLALLLLCIRLVAQPHPLDALSSAEYWTVYETLRAGNHLAPDTLFASVLLHPPDKAAVLAGRTAPRQADAVLLREGKSFAALVDVTARRVVSFNELKNAQAPFLGSELGASSEIVKKDPRIIEALRKRGITDLTHVKCYALPVAWRGVPEQATERLGFGGCSAGHRTLHSWGRSIEGLTFSVNLATRKVVKVNDTEVVTVPTASNDYEEIPDNPRPYTTPILTAQPQGPGFRVQNGEVSWQNWRFRFRLDPRLGPVLNLVRLVDGGRERSVLYEASVSELFVPYMDPADGWNNRAFIDAGQFYATSPFIQPLKPGLDCPAHATWFDAIFPTETGAPKLHSRLACLFERHPESPAWRHGEDGEIFGRPTRQLVLRTAAVVGNYDYLMDWRFDPDGAIEVAVGATGVIETKSATLAKPPATQIHASEETGQYVAEHTIGVNHDHFFSFRLDFDVDGTENSFLIHRLTPKRIENDPWRRSIWVAKPSLAATESEAILDQDAARPAMWTFINPGVRGSLNHPAGFELMPGKAGRSLMFADDPTQKIGAFSAHQFYVTPYRAQERYAAGVYPTSSRAEDGLADWVKANRPIVNTDLVGWYTLGFHHIARAEDWPVMPTMWHHFHIRPFHFFPRNPVLDLPRSLETTAK